MPNTPTLNEVLGWAVSRLQRDAVGDPRREAVGLWARVTETDPAMPLTAADRQVQEDQWSVFGPRWSDGLPESRRNMLLVLRDSERWSFGWIAAC